MNKLCKTCGRKKHKGLCDLVTLTNGRVIHASLVTDDMQIRHRNIRKPLSERKRIR